MIENDRPGTEEEQIAEDMATEQAHAAELASDDAKYRAAEEQRIAIMLELLDQETRTDYENEVDRALWCLLKRWEDKLPYLDGYFHKAFRQVDVTDDGHTDAAIWHLLNVSKLFWRVFERVQDEKPIEETKGE